MHDACHSGAACGMPCASACKNGANVQRWTGMHIGSPWHAACIMQHVCHSAYAALRHAAHHHGALCSASCSLHRHGACTVLVHVAAQQRCCSAACTNLVQRFMLRRTRAWGYPHFRRRRMHPGTLAHRKNRQHGRLHGRKLRQRKFPQRKKKVARSHAVLEHCMAIQYQARGAGKAPPSWRRCSPRADWRLHVTATRSSGVPRTT